MCVLLKLTSAKQYDGNIWHIAHIPLNSSVHSALHREMHEGAARPSGIRRLVREFGVLEGLESVVGLMVVVLVPVLIFHVAHSSHGLPILVLRPKVYNHCACSKFPKKN